MSEMIVEKDSDVGDVYLSVVHHHKELDEPLWTLGRFGFLKKTHSTTFMLMLSFKKHNRLS